MSKLKEVLVIISIVFEVQSQGLEERDLIGINEEINSSPSLPTAFTSTIAEAIEVRDYYLVPILPSVERRVGEFCKYSEYISIVCSSDSQELNIKEEMNKIYSELQYEWQRRFPSFRWNANLTQGIIPENTFQNFRIINFEFDSKNLEKIHSKAFFGLYTKEGTKVWNHSSKSSTKLKNFPNSEYDLYKSFELLEELQDLTINLDSQTKHEIPDNTFATNKWNQLLRITFNGNFILKNIGNYLTFYLPKSFQTISFEGILIEMISENAFQMKQCFDCNSVFIGLQSTQLNELKVKKFNISGRAVDLHLENNNFQVLEENVFKDFLLSNPRNKIFLDKNRLKCEQKSRFQWILKNSNNYRNQVLNAFCSDGTSLWDYKWPEEGEEEEEEVICNKNNEYDGEYGIEKWPQVSAGEYSQVNCSNNSNGKIRWKCLSNGKFSEFGPEFEECWLESIIDIENITTIEEVSIILEELVEKTSNESSLNSISSLEKIIEIIEKLEDFLKYKTIDSMISQNLSQSFVLVFSQTISQRNAWNSGKEREKVKIGSKLLFHIQRTAFLTNCFLNQNQSEKQFFSHNLYEKHYFNYTKSIRFQYNYSSISVPKKSHFIEEEDEEEESCSQDNAMAALINTLSDYLEKEKSFERINSNIIAFSLKNSNKSVSFKNNDFVKIRLKHKNRLLLGDKISCSFWDFSSLEWSSKGCNVLVFESNREYTVCECNHLTNFAVIMDLSGREDNSLGKHILTLILCSLSIICLSLTMGLIFKRKSFGKLFRAKKVNEITKSLIKRRDFIVFNQSLCLLISDLIIITLMEKMREKNQVLCEITSFTLLFTLLSAFVWMSLNGFHLFRMTNDVFKESLKHSYLLLIGYGFPLFISLFGLLLIKNDSYFAVSNEFFCWISSEKNAQNIWILCGPALVSIVFNLFIIGFLAKLIRKKKKSWKQVSAFGLLSLNLGISWILFLSYMQRKGNSPKVFSYIFVVLNASQGIFIFVYQLLVQIK